MTGWKLKENIIKGWRLKENIIMGWKLKKNIMKSWIKEIYVWGDGNWTKNIFKVFEIEEKYEGLEIKQNIMEGLKMKKFLWSVGNHKEYEGLKIE